MSEQEQAKIAREAYDQKVREYEQFVSHIHDLQQMPSNAEKAVMLQNFLNYLNNARFYMDFYRQYAKYWTLGSSRDIVPVRGGLFVPVERAKKDEILSAEQRVEGLVLCAVRSRSISTIRVREGSLPDTMWTAVWRTGVVLSSR